MNRLIAKQILQILRRSETLLLIIVVLVAGQAFAQQKESLFQKTAARLAAAPNYRLKVAFVVTDGAVLIDFAGPWEVFEQVALAPKGHSMHEPGVARNPFDLYVVSDAKRPIRTSGGMQIIPDYSFDDAPAPNVIVIPAQDGESPKMMDWIRKMHRSSDVTMSVCVGAFTLAQTGLLDGKSATTHHDAWGMLHAQFPKIRVEGNRRWVESDPVLFTSGGLSSGIDLALHIVELYFGRQVAEDTAYQMEYEGTGWKGNGTAGVKYKDGMSADGIK